MALRSQLPGRLFHGRSRIWQQGNYLPVTTFFEATQQGWSIAWLTGWLAALLAGTVATLWQDSVLCCCCCS